jgi:DNA-binding MarR family transcriptional regulator
MAHILAVFTQIGYGAHMTDDAAPDPHCFLRGDDKMRELARSKGLSQTAADAVASIDASMATIRRNVMRREFGKRILAHLKTDLEIGHMDTIGAIGHADLQSPAEEVTVGLVAERLGLDPSRASRLVSDVVDKGYARRVASQSDARRICLEPTPKGRRFLEQIRETKWRAFAHSLSQWSEDDLVTFARLFERYTDWTRDGFEAMDAEMANKTAAE